MSKQHCTSLNTAALTVGFNEDCIYIESYKWQNDSKNLIDFVYVDRYGWIWIVWVVSDFLLSHLCDQKIKTNPKIIQDDGCL